MESIIANGNDTFFLNKNPKTQTTTGIQMNNNTKMTDVSKEFGE